MVRCGRAIVILFVAADAIARGTLEDSILMALLASDLGVSSNKRENLVVIDGAAPPRVISGVVAVLAGCRVTCSAMIWSRRIVVIFLMAGDALHFSRCKGTGRMAGVAG